MCIRDANDGKSPPKMDSLRDTTMTALIYAKHHIMIYFCCTCFLSFTTNYVPCCNFACSSRNNECKHAILVFFLAVIFRPKMSYSNSMHELSATSMCIEQEPWPRMQTAIEHECGGSKIVKQDFTIKTFCVAHKNNELKVIIVIMSLLEETSANQQISIFYTRIFFPLFCCVCLALSLVLVCLAWFASFRKFLTF